MHEQLALHNDKKLTNRTYSRQEYFDLYEKAELRLLPLIDFEIKNHRIPKVQKNSHILTITHILQIVNSSIIPVLRGFELIQASQTVLFSRNYIITLRS